jgi:hypothetical protein
MKWFMTMQDVSRNSEFLECSFNSDQYRLGFTEKLAENLRKGSEGDIVFRIDPDFYGYGYVYKDLQFVTWKHHILASSDYFNESIIPTFHI